jgi:hypothetical protein
MSRTATPRSRIKRQDFSCLCSGGLLEFTPEGMMIEVFEENCDQIGSDTEDRGSDGVTSAGTGPLRSATGRLKIHRLGGPLRGLVQQALKLARKVDV